MSFGRRMSFERCMLRGGLLVACGGFLLAACGKDEQRVADAYQGTGGRSIVPPGAGGAKGSAGGSGGSNSGAGGDESSTVVGFPPDVGGCLDSRTLGFGGAGGAGGAGGDEGAEVDGESGRSFSVDGTTVFPDGTTLLGSGELVSADGVTALPEGETVLRGAPLLFAPTMSSFGISAVVGAGDPRQLYSCVRRMGDELWQPVPASTVVAKDAARWSVRGLSAGSSYEYVVRSGENTLFFGSVTTQRPPGESYRFSIMTDSHTSPRDVPVNEPDDAILPSNDRFKEETLLKVAQNIGSVSPDFIVNLGDIIDYHNFGFNIPTPSAYHTRIAYLNHRRLYGETLGNAAHFPVIGNWEGENGDFTAEEIDTARNQRFVYMPAPEPDTYPQGGSENEDYYAYTWGDALFIVLNVMTYTPTTHLLDGIGAADDWTLGQEQLSWFEKTLEEADSKWRFVMIHHTVGGKAGDDANSIYGRGGGLAARVGEQAVVHQLMIDHGVQVFFFGHDHVFTDMVVDGIHYTLPGSSGAPWKFGESDTGYAIYWSDSGHANIEVSPESVLVEFIGLDGQPFYSYTLTE